MTIKFARRNAFTMIEIAIALAVIAFALVAIIGVLPTGMNVQKDNREDTIINQDGPYWLEALRGGSKGLDHLTNHVERIGIVLADFHPTNSASYRTNYFDYDQAFNKTGSNIIGLLSIPRGSIFDEGGRTSVVARVIAQVRALTGPASEQGLANRDFAFSYIMSSEISPFQTFARDSTNFTAYPTNTVDWTVRSNRWVEAFHLRNNTYEARLAFRWPVIDGDKVGPGRQTFRTLISGQLERENGFNNHYFFHPQDYVKQ